MKTEWFVVGNPPAFEEGDGLDWAASKRVLVVLGGGYITVGTYEQLDEDSPPKWYSSCSERWELKNVTHWTFLPEVP